MEYVCCDFFIFPDKKCVLKIIITTTTEDSNDGQLAKNKSKFIPFSPYYNFDYTVLNITKISKCWGLGKAFPWKEICLLDIHSFYVKNNIE